VQTQLHERVEVPVSTRPEHGDEIAVLEQETSLVRIDLVTMEHWSVPPFV
jgi:hypothetical protein